MKRIISHLPILWLAADVLGQTARLADAQPVDGGGPYPSHFIYSVAIKREPGVSRRDPSDVIQVGHEYYVWYSKVRNGPGVWAYPSGYSADVWYAVSPDGHQWQEKGEAIGKGAPGQWDEFGVFTPNILIFGGKFYLFYTGVAAGHNETTHTHIGVAVGDSPDGPWKKFDGNPILSPSQDPAQFDSMRVDDAALVTREGKIWLYYKGRQMQKTPAETKLGVAFANTPTGPYVKYGLPLHHGHEVMVWSQGKGVASLAVTVPRMIYFAQDGLHFEPRNMPAKVPTAPGAWRSDGFANDATGKGLEWGISQANAGGDVYLVRFDCATDASVRSRPAGAVASP